MTAQTLVDAYRSVDADAMRDASKNPYFAQIEAVAAAICGPIPPAWMDGSYLSEELHAELKRLDPPKSSYMSADCASAIREALGKVRKSEKRTLFAGLVATGDADAETAAHIVSGLSAAASQLTAAGVVQTQRHKPRGKRATNAMIHLAQGARGWAFPVGGGKHMIATDPKRWRWQESPDESDVSGTFHGFGGRTLSTAAAGRHNAERARAEIAASAASATLAATLGEPVMDGTLPTDSVLLRDDRPQSQFGGRLGGTRHYRTPDGRYATVQTEYDWPTRVAISAEPVDVSIIAAGLGIDPEHVQ